MPLPKWMIYYNAGKSHVGMKWGSQDILSQRSSHIKASRQKSKHGSLVPKIGITFASTIKFYGPCSQITC